MGIQICGDIGTVNWVWVIISIIIVGAVLGVAVWRKYNPFIVVLLVLTIIEILRSFGPTDCGNFAANTESKTKQIELNCIYADTLHSKGAIVSARDNYLQYTGQEWVENNAGIPHASVIDCRVEQ